MNIFQDPVYSNIYPISQLQLILHEEDDLSFPMPAVMPVPQEPEN
jgi:hypothetical protein